AIDSNIVDKILVEPGLLQELQAAAARGALVFVTHHVIRDQLVATYEAKRVNLLATFDALPQTSVPTAGVVLDLSKVDGAAPGQSGALEAVKTRGKGAMHDALIAATASGYADVLVTEDHDLRKKVTSAGVRCEVWASSDLLSFVRPM